MDDQTDQPPPSPSPPSPPPPPSPSPPPPPPLERSQSDAPDQETMEAIRQRRVAKLSSQNTQPPATTTMTASANTSISASTPPPQQPHQTMAPEGQSSANASPVLRSDQAEVATPVPDLKRALAIGESGDFPAVATPPPRKKTATPHEEPLADWADRTLTGIFRITLDPAQTTDPHGHKTVFLPSLRQERDDSGALPRLTADTLDSALLEAATLYPHNRPLLEYLLPCWKRAVRSIRLLRAPTPEKEAVLEEAKRLCFSNCIFAVTVPELFGREDGAVQDSLMPCLLKDVDHEDALCMDFLTEAVSRLDDDESIAPLFTRTMVELSTRLSGMNMNQDYKPYVNALLTYSRFSPLLNALAQDPCFLAAQSAPGIEKHTLLGPFFRISPLQPEVTTVYFTGPRSMAMDTGRIKTSQKALQMTLATHQTDLRVIINAFIRASPQTRNRVLDWFAYIMNVNHKRRAMQVDAKDVSSDGFMMNVTVVLDYLSEPFMDATFSKVGRIDIDYFRRSPRVNIKEETKLNADQAQSDAFYATTVGGENNFITEIFFLTLAAHHYGSEATNSKMKNLEKDIKYYERHLAHMELERPKFAAQPAQLRLFEETLKRHTAVLEKVMSLRFSIEGVLLDEKMQSRSLQFMRYVTVWLLRVASQSDYTPGASLLLPLPADQPESFRCLPEYALQDIVDNFKFVFRHLPQIILSAVSDEMVALCITFLESSEYIKNPYLKSSLVSLLFSGTWPTYHLRKGVLGDLMTNTKFANEHLLHAVMKFYIECESTGANSAFYDKFNIRFEIFQVVKCIWSNDVYKQQLTQQSKSERAFFVRFVNLLMNDATYVLDEGLGKFPKIHELQVALKDTSLSQQDREKKEEDLQAAERQAQSYMQLANESVAMMKLFTSTLGESFTMPEIVQRLAGMLDYNLDTLVGPKQKTLKVDNPAKYYFNPKTLLPEMIEIYLNLGSSEPFIQAVAGDGRSYKPGTFLAATRILKSKVLMAEPELRAWEALCQRFETAKEMLDKEELDYGDIPAEYEDPIMGDIMKDPVILPSKHTVDRSTIVQHLLSDMKDPFTRQAMTIDDVIPDTELRDKIKTWKEQRRAEARSKAVGDGGPDAMDTTE